MCVLGGGRVGVDPVDDAVAAIGGCGPNHGFPSSAASSSSRSHPQNDIHSPGGAVDAVASLSLSATTPPFLRVIQGAPNAPLDTHTHTQRQYFNKLHTQGGHFLIANTYRLGQLKTTEYILRDFSREPRVDLEDLQMLRCSQGTGGD